MLLICSRDCDCLVFTHTPTSTPLSFYLVCRCVGIATQVSFLILLISVYTLLFIKAESATFHVFDHLMFNCFIIFNLSDASTSTTLIG